MEPTPKETIKEIPIGQIIEPATAMRSDIDWEKIKELAENIRSIGLISPITVRPVGAQFEVVAGHCRLLACRMIGYLVLPCVVRTLTDDQVFAFKSAENLARNEVDPVDIALFIGKFVGEDATKIPMVADLLKRSEKWVLDRLDILTYPDYFLPGIKDGTVSLGVAKFLSQIHDETYRRMFWESAYAHGMKVWQAETCLRQYEQGILQKSDVILPDPSEKNPRPAAVFRTTCEKCGEMGETPNLKTVWIHGQCPTQEKADTKAP